MRSQLPAALFSVAVLTVAAHAQGPIERAGQALDNAGRNIRRGVENAVARGQMTAQERELLGRVSQRLAFDKQLVNSTLQLTVQPDGAVVLQGSVMDVASKKRAVDLTESTLGVITVVDQLAIVTDVKVIQAAPARVIVAPLETQVIVPPSRVVVPPGTEVVVPVESKVIVKP
jgi:hyperosmotically inducible periplasmic protein